MSDAKRLVVLCECGPIIKELVDLDELGRLAAQMPGVAKVERVATLCSAEGKEWFAQKLRENPDLLPVVAACSPREHVDDLNSACEAAGRNAYTMSRANIREQVAWVTPDKSEATAKAADMVAAAVARVAEQVALEAAEVDCETSVLVVGSGVAGMSAALLLADSGRDVIVVEREPAVGGRTVLLSEIYPDMDCAPCLLEPLMDRLLHHPHIEVLTSAEVEDVTGYLGNFTTTVRKKARHVDIDGCYGCRTCAGACPVSVPDKYNAGLTNRTAVFIPYMGALPNASVVDEATCLHFNGGDCEACVAACPFGNIDLGGSDEVVERHDVAVGDVLGLVGLEVEYIGPLPGGLTDVSMEELPEAEIRAAFREQIKSEKSHDVDSRFKFRAATSMRIEPILNRQFPPHDLLEVKNEGNSFGRTEVLDCPHPDDRVQIFPIGCGIPILEKGGEQRREVLPQDLPDRVAEAVLVLLQEV